MEWYVVKIDTNNGLRIGITQESDAPIIVAGPFDEAEATRFCKEFMVMTGIPEFDEDVDEEI